MTTNQKMAERLRDARAHAGYARPTEAARAMGVEPPTYMGHENGSRGFRDDAPRYADFFRVDLEWLLTGKGTRHGKRGTGFGTTATKPDGNDEFTAVGRYDAAFSMGPGSLVADQPEPLGYWMIETQWLRSMTRSLPDDLAIVRVSGDSMIRTLFDGDWVLIDRKQIRATREGIYALRVGDDCWVKRLSLNLKTHTIRVISDNVELPAQQQVQEVEEQDLSILGRVISLVARRVA